MGKKQEFSFAVEGLRVSVSIEEKETRVFTQALTRNKKDLKGLD